MTTPRAFLFALFAMLTATAAQAQAPASVPTMAQMPAGSCNGSPMSWNGTQAICVPWPAGGGSVAIQGGACAAVTGSGTATSPYVISVGYAPLDVPSARAIATSDTCKMLKYTGASPGNFPLPTIGSAAGNVGSGFNFCFKVPKGSGSATFTSSQPIEGGFLTIDALQEECFMVDADLQWMMYFGPSWAVPNPHAIQ